MSAQLAPVQPLRIGATSAFNEGTTSVTVSKPAGVEAGDLLVISFFLAANRVPTAPAGFAEVAALIGAHNTMYIWQKTTSAGEPANYTVSLSSSDNCAAVCVAYRGATAVSQVGVYAYSPPETALSMDQAAAGVLLAAFGTEGGRGFVSPAGMVSVGSARGSYGGIGLAELNPSPAGVTGNKTASWTGGSFSSGVQFCVS